MNVRNEHFLRDLILEAFYAHPKTKELVVLKGGQALNLYGFSSRESYDIDFTIKQAKEKVFEELNPLVKENLAETFLKRNYYFFDYRFDLKPKKRHHALPPYWGGYAITFKVIPLEEKKNIENQYPTDKEKQLERMRASAAPFGKNNSTKVELDFSYHEYVGELEQIELVSSITESGYKVSLYRPIILVYEKMRALCQNIPGDHLPVNKNARVRDLYDIYSIVYSESKYALEEEDILENIHELKKSFEAKEVSLELLLQLSQSKESLEKDFYDTLLQTVPEAKKVGFQYIYEYTENLMIQCHHLLSNKLEG